MSDEISLAEALSYASRFTKMYQSFAKIEHVLEKARQVEGQRESLWADIEHKTHELNSQKVQAEEALKALQLEHAENLQEISEQIAEAKADAEKQIKEQEARVQKAIDEAATRIDVIESNCSARSGELHTAIKQLEEREDILTGEVEKLEQKKADLLDFFKGMNK